MEGAAECAPENVVMFAGGQHEHEHGMRCAAIWNNVWVSGWVELASVHGKGWNLRAPVRHRVPSEMRRGPAPVPTNRMSWTIRVRLSFVNCNGVRLVARERALTEVGIGR